ncbi:MAG: hypothetical protein IJV15_02130 [Lachnospiraceae bacterium]|nr:hypothetical protein [Lachnospiraceae bacterium]
MRIRLSAKQPNVEKFIDGIIDRYHFEKKDKETLINIYEKLSDAIAPMAAYRINRRVTGYKVIDDNPAAIVVLTLGDGPDEIKDKYTKDGKLDKSYMLDCITNEMLMNMYVEFNQTYAKYHRRYVKRYVFIGDEISTEKIPELLNEIYSADKSGAERKIFENIKANGKKSDFDESDNNDESNDNNVSEKVYAEEIGLIETPEIKKKSDYVSANSYGVMTPTKSVVFYAILTENPNQICEGICENCNNKKCENNPEYVEETE